MGKPVFDYGLAELLELPEHRGAPPGITPRGRACADRLLALVWSVPPDRREAAVAAIEQALRRS